jgi:ketosteroid isomerase-like protein
VLSATDRIRNLLGAYCERIDAGDFEGVGALFADGALADEAGTELARGSSAVTAFFRNTVRLHDGSPRTKHLVVNTVFEEPAAAAVTARSSYVVLQDADGPAIRPIITGRYIDRFALGGDGEWRFAERRFAVDLTGDLARHMAWEL